MEKHYGQKIGDRPCQSNFDKQLSDFGTLKSLINEQGGYVVFLVLSEYPFIRDFRVLTYYLVI